MLRKTTLAAAAVAFATAGSALFGGVALADDGTDSYTGGDGGAGGYAPNNCFQPAIFGSGNLIDVALPIALLGDADASQNNNPVCVSNAPGGAGGNVD